MSSEWRENLGGGLAEEKKKKSYHRRLKKKIKRNKIKYDYNIYCTLFRHKRFLEGHMKLHML